jgi:hypothetical protein
MPPQTRASARVASQPPERGQEAIAESNSQGSSKRFKPLPTATDASFWQFPGFLFQVKPNVKHLPDLLLFSAFTDPPVLESEANEPKTMRLQSRSVCANNNLAVLFKGLLFHQNNYLLCRQELLMCLNGLPSPT